MTELGGVTIQSINKLLESVYSTVSNDTDWQMFCELFTQKTDAPLMMFGHNLTQEQSLGIVGGGFDPSELDRYHRHFANINPWMKMNETMPVGMVGISDQAVDQDELFRTEFYNDWLRHQGKIAGGPAMICHRSTNRLAVMAACCFKNDYETKVSKTSQLFKLLGPHIKRAVQLSQVLNNSTSHSGNFLNALRVGVLLIDQSGKVAHTNQIAENIISRWPKLLIGRDRSVQSGDEVLARFLKRSIDVMERQSFVDLPAPVRVDLNENNFSIFHAHIFPQNGLSDFPQNVWCKQISGAIVITDELGLTDLNRDERLPHAFGATPAEAKLAQSLISGKTLRNYAEQNLLSLHTVRNQMRSLLHKTNTDNQQDFIQLILRLNSPFSK